MSPVERARREKQRTQPTPSRRPTLHKKPIIPASPASPVDPDSAGARNVLLDPRPPPPPAQLVYTRAQARVLLGNVSVMTLIRMERQKLLKPIRMTKGKAAQVFYSYQNILDVAQGRGKH